MCNPIEYEDTEDPQEIQRLIYEANRQIAAAERSAQYWRSYRTMQEQKLRDVLSAQPLQQRFEVVARGNMENVREVWSKYEIATAYTGSILNPESVKPSGRLGNWKQEHDPLKCKNGDHEDCFRAQLATLGKEEAADER